MEPKIQKPFFSCFFFIFLMMNLIIPQYIYSTGIRENLNQRDWDRIEYSDTIKYYKVLVNQRNEKIGLEETGELPYGEEIVISYETDKFRDGQIAQFMIFDYNMENAIYRPIRIMDNKITFEGVILTSRQAMENMMNENKVQFFCLILLPDSSMIRSKLLPVNLTAHITLGYGLAENYINAIMGKETLGNTFFYILESDDGEYRQERSVLNDGIIETRESGNETRTVIRLVYTDLLPNKTYIVTWRTSTLNMVISDEHILDIMRYY